MKPWLVWTVGVALVVAAWAVMSLTPDEDIVVSPFAVPASVGTEADARAFTVTVTDTRLGDRAVADGWSGDGTWLVVDLELAARGTYRDALNGVAALLRADFVIGGATYRASERPPSIFNTGPVVGIPQVGSLAFELPADAAGRTGTLRISGDAETRLDAVVEVQIDLDALTRQTEVELLDQGWANK